MVDIDHRQLFVAKRAMSFTTLVKDAIVLMTDAGVEERSNLELHGNCWKLFQPSRTLFVLPKLMTASLTNLIDGYISVHDAFNLYASFYALLLDFVEEYPSLVEEANNLVAYAGDLDELQPLDPSSVSLEEFISLLSITDGITWEDIGEKHVHLYYKESVDKKAHMELLLLQIHTLHAFQSVLRNKWLDEESTLSMTQAMEKRYGEIMEGAFETLEEPIPFYRDIVLLLKKSRAHILVVTSDKLSQKVYVALLKRLEYSTITLVDNGLQSVEACEKCTYDVILMEIRMPSVSGWDTARLIREKERRNSSRRTPIIGMTCVLSDRDIVSDIDDYLVLPLSKGSLQSIIEHYLMLGAVKKPLSSL